MTAADPCSRSLDRAKRRGQARSPATRSTGDSCSRPRQYDLMERLLAGKDNANARSMPLMGGASITEGVPCPSLSFASGRPVPSPHSSSVDGGHPGW